MKKEVEKIKHLTNDFLVPLGIMSFSLGFALFVTSLIKLIEAKDPKVTLVIGIGMMLVPVFLGIWEFRHVKRKVMHNLKRLKTA